MKEAKKKQMQMRVAIKIKTTPKVRPGSPVISPTRKLTAKERKALGDAVFDRVSNLLEFWDEMTQGSRRSYEDLEDVDVGSAAEVIATWMKKIPSNTWPHMFNPGGLP